MAPGRIVVIGPGEAIDAAEASVIFRAIQSPPTAQDKFRVRRLSEARDAAKFEPSSQDRMSLRLAVLISFMLLAATCASRAADMSFGLVPVGSSEKCDRDCPLAMVAQGEITNDTPEQFTAFLSAHRSPNMLSVVYLDSLGGKVVSSMELGQSFRRLGVVAIVGRPVDGDGTKLAPGRCFSACVYALIGAKQRVIPPQSAVGIHRMFSYDSTNDPAGGTARNVHHDDGGMRELIAQYSSEMGVSRGLIDAAEQTSSDSIYVLSQADISRWRLGASRISLDEPAKTHRRRKRAGSPDRALDGR